MFIKEHSLLSFWISAFIYSKNTQNNWIGVFLVFFSAYENIPNRGVLECVEFLSKNIIYLFLVSTLPRILSFPILEYICLLHVYGTHENI